MSKLPSTFLNHWLLIQIFGSIALAIATQSLVALIILLAHVDNLPTILLLRVGGCLLSSIMQGYLQWQLLKQVFKSLDRQWISTTVAALPITILSWGLIHLGIKMLVLDEDGTIFIILAIVGGICGGINGRLIGNWQKSLFKERLYWRSLWHNWDREQILAGVLSGIATSIVIICAVFVYGWDWIISPISAFICSICLASVSQIMYGLIVGDTIQDVFKQAKLIE
jgi:hypothetical protein